MKLTKTVYKSEKVEMEVEFPFFCKDENSHTIVCADEKGELYGIKVWALNDLSSITTIIGVSDIKLEGQCAEQDFWTAFAEVTKLLSKKEFMCRQAGKQTVKEWDMTNEETFRRQAEERVPLISEMSHDDLSEARGDLNDEFDGETPLGEHQDTLGELED